MVVVQSLFTERLTQTLHKLVLNRQTGLMSIEHIGESSLKDSGSIQKQHHERGEIYFEQGEVVLARSGSEVGVAALARIQSWQRASYTFYEDATIPLLSLPRLAKSTRPLPQVPATPQSQPAHSTHTHGTPPVATLPGKYAIFHAYPSAATPITMKRLQRRQRIIFALLDGRHTIQDIAALVHQSDVSVARIIVQLYYQGYIEYLRG